MRNFDITGFVVQIIETFSKFFEIVTGSVNELVTQIGIDVELGIIGDMSLYQLMLGSGFLVFIVYTVAKWVISA